MLWSSSVTPVISTLALGTLWLIAVIRGDADAAAVLYVDMDPLRGIRFAANFTVEGLLGLLSATQGMLDQVIANFDDMLAICRRAGYQPELAWTCHDYALAVLHPTAAATSVSDLANRMQVDAPRIPFYSSRYSESPMFKKISLI